MESNLVYHLTRIQEYEDTDFRWKNLRKIVQKWVKGNKILDAGCGTGHLTLDLLYHGYEVTAIDSSPDLIRIVENVVERYGFSLNTSVSLVEDCTTLGKDSFDGVICLDVLEHVKDDTKALSAFHSLLKDSGQLIISVPALKSLYGKRDLKIGHFRRYNKEELIRKLTDTGFRIQVIRYWNFSGVIPFFIFEKVLHKGIYEGMRYSRNSPFSIGLNGLLDLWFRTIENNIKFPIGLSLIIVCEKSE
jgi:SAM-dependent methyltransferase